MSPVNGAWNSVELQHTARRSSDRDSDREKLLERAPSKRTSRVDATAEDVLPGEAEGLAPAALSKPAFIILPDSRFRRTWVQVTLIVALYIVWVTPIRVGYDMQAQGFWFWMEGVINVFYICDLVMNFFVAYEHPVTSELVADHSRIARRYLRGWFWVDLLATFPSDYVVKGIKGQWACSFTNTCYAVVPRAVSHASLIAMLPYMRLFRVVWILKNFSVLSVRTILGHRLTDELLAWRWIITVAELLVALIYLGHLTGCFFYMFSHPRWQTPEEQRLIDSGELSTWVLDKMGAYEVHVAPTLVSSAAEGLLASDQVAKDPASGDWYQCPKFFMILECLNCQAAVKLRCLSDFGFAFRYVSSMYWAYTTMTTVGYGDIAGTTIAEKVWCMVTMVIGGFFLSFTFGRMATVVGRLDADTAARNELMDDVSQLLRDVDLPRPLSRRVLDFVRTSAKSIKPYDRAAVLGRLPFDLRSKIMRHLYLPTIKAVPLLGRLADDDVFLTDLCVRLQPYHCSSETFVFQRGEPSSDIFVLMRGEVVLVPGPLLDGKGQHQGTNGHSAAASLGHAAMSLPLLSAFRDRTAAILSSLGPGWSRVAPGGVFGEGGILRQADEKAGARVRRDEAAFCITASDMLMLPAEDALDLCEQYPQLKKSLRFLRAARHPEAAVGDEQEAAAQPSAPAMQPAL